MGLDIRFVLLDDTRDDKEAAVAEEAEKMAPEPDEDLRRQVCHDQVEGPREGGNVAVEDLDAILDLVDQDVFMCDLHRFLVDVHAQDPLGVQFRTGDTEDSRSRSDVQDMPLLDAPALQEDFFAP